MKAWVVLLVSNTKHFTSELVEQMTADGEDEYEVVRLSFFKERTATLAARLGPLVKLLRVAKPEGMAADHREERVRVHAGARWKGRASNESVSADAVAELPYRCL